MPAAGGGPSTRTVARITLTVAAVVVLLYLLYIVRSVLVLIFISAFLALAFGPAVDFFVRRGLPRSVAILSTYLSIFAAIVGVGLLIVPPVVNGVENLSQDIPGYVRDLRKSDQFRKYDNRYHISSKLNEQAKTLPTKLGDAAGALQSVTVGVFSTLVQLVTVLTMTFFFLKDGERIVGFGLRLLGPREQRFRAVSGDIYRSVSGYVAGNLIISVIAGMVAWISLTLLGVPFAVPLAVLVAFLDLIPLVGATIGAVVVGIVTAFHDFPTATIIWAVIALTYQQVENNVLQPVVYRRTVDVPPLAVIVAILIGSSLLGVLGALVAIPIAATVQIVAKDLWRTRAGEPVLPPGTELPPPAPT
jgi:predicted PurR-regulated permease PerM